MFDRNQVAKKLLQVYWPTHDVFFIDNHDNYNNIDQLLSSKKSNNVIICQVEEDTFFWHKIPELRKKIKNSPHWTNQSFLITNSERDYRESSKIIKTLFRPGILDIVSYKDYNTNDVNLDIEYIKFHTSFLFSFSRPKRDQIAQLLSEHPEKVSVLKYFNKVKNESFTISNLNSDSSFFPAGTLAPDINIQSDLSWSKYSAFTIAFENYHHGDDLFYPPYECYAPTLSEKTYKSMHLLRPALSFGGTGTRDYLQRWGFDTWDWFTDWSFDREPDYQKSLYLYYDELKRLINTDINEIKDILKRNKDALIHNREQIFKILKNYDSIDI